MAIAAKPKTVRPEGRTSVDVDALINKGLALRPQKSPGERVPVLLKIPGNIAGRLDDAVSAAPIRMSRHSWILNAILEKLEREGK